MMKTNKEIDIWQLILHLWRNKKTVFLYGGIGALVGLVAALSIPKEYVCTVIVAPEKNQSTNGAMANMGGLASMMGVNIGNVNSNGINDNLYPDIVKSSPFIAEFEEIPIVYKDQTITFFDYLTKEQKYAWWKSIMNFPYTVIGWFSSDTLSSNGKGSKFKDTTHPTGIQYYYEGSFTQRVTLVQDKKTNVIEISVKMQDPKVSYIIADSIIRNLEKYVINYQTNKISSDLNKTIKTQQEAKAEFYIADSLYAHAQDRNQSIISKSTTIKINRFKDERDLCYSVYEQLSNKVEALKIKLQEETPVITIIEPARVPLQAESPKKFTIIFGFFVLGCIISVGKLGYHHLFNKELLQNNN